MNPKISSNHPIDENVRAAIVQSLQGIERKYEVTILYACESGSRAWGFASPDSDYDVRFIYVPRLPWYLSVEPQRDVIELPIDDALDINGWELRKTLQLLLRSNPVLLEWLDSPVVYREEAETVRRLRVLAQTHFSSLKGYHHYLTMAKSNFRGYLQDDQVRLKKYLYVLRPLLAVRWIETRQGQPPMRFADLAVGTLDDPALLDEINRLLDIKMRSGEAEYSERWPGIHAFIEQELNRLASNDFEQKMEHKNVEELDHFLRETVHLYSDGLQ